MMMSSGGAKVWYFADGYLPKKNPADAVEAHEALMLFNPTEMPVDVLLDLYFSERQPVKNIPVRVSAETVKTLRLDHPEDLGGVEIAPLTQYALRIRAEHPIVAQFGRVDTAQSNLSYYVGVGFHE